MAKELTVLAFPRLAKGKKDYLCDSSLRGVYFDKTKLRLQLRDGEKDMQGLKATETVDALFCPGYFRFNFLGP